MMDLQGREDIAGNSSACPSWVQQGFPWGRGYGKVHVLLTWPSAGVPPVCSLPCLGDKLQVSAAQAAGRLLSTLTLGSLTCLWNLYFGVTQVLQMSQQTKTKFFGCFQTSQLSSLESQTYAGFLWVKWMVSMVLFRGDLKFCNRQIAYFSPWPGPVAWRIQFHDQWSNPCPQQRKQRVLTTGPPGKSLLLSPDLCFSCCGYLTLSLTQKTPFKCILQETNSLLPAIAGAMACG